MFFFFFFFYVLIDVKRMVLLIILLLLLLFLYVFYINLPLSILFTKWKIKAIKMWRHKYGTEWYFFLQIFYFFWLKASEFFDCWILYYCFFFFCILLFLFLHTYLVTIIFFTRIIKTNVTPVVSCHIIINGSIYIRLWSLYLNFDRIWFMFSHRRD